jgi:hypothetical protein
LARETVRRKKTFSSLDFSKLESGAYFISLTTSTRAFIGKNL